MKHATAPVESERSSFRSGWCWLLLESVSRVYLFGLLTLAACALLPALLGWQQYVIQSGSMEPHIEVGDVVLTSKIRPDAPVPVGRVVAFKSPAAAGASGHASIRMHRIVYANPGKTYTTAGDANPTVDSTPIKRDQIIGQGRILVPWVGLPAFWAQTAAYVKLGLWLGATLLALLVIGFSPSTRPKKRPHPQSRPRTTKPVAIAATTALGLVPVLTFGLPSQPGGPIDAAFTDQTTNAGNNWGVAVNKSKATSSFQVYDTPSSGGWYQRDSVGVNISATASSGSKVRSITYRVNGGSAITTQSSSVGFRVGQQGDNTITYFATDSAGVAETMHTTHVKLDNSAPTLTVTSRTGDMTHAQWKVTCATQTPSGGVCGATTDTNGSGLGSVKYVLSRSSDSRCFDGTGWTSAACSTRTAATIAANTWFTSVPDAQLARARSYYTITVFATDVAGNAINTTKNFSVG